MSDVAPVMLPASFAQELLWLTERASPGGGAYNVPRTRRLVGALSVLALQAALDDVVARHEILRTTYGVDNDHPVQVIHPPRPVIMEGADLGALTADAAEREARRLIETSAWRPFDLSREAPFRVLLVRLREDEHLLQITSHHIAADGGSRDVLFRDLDACYTARRDGGVPLLPELSIQFADYAVWQREQLSGERLDALLAFWRAHLGGAEFVLGLPTDFPRPPVAGTEGVTASVVLPDRLTAGLRELARRHDATLNMVLLAGYAALLHRYTGHDDVLVGSPIAARSLPETEGLIGYFANTIVHRGRFGGDPSFAALVAQIRDGALGAYEHQDIPFEKLVLELQSGQALSHTPLFQAVFTMLESGDGSRGRLGDLDVQPFAAQSQTTKFDLTLFMAEQGERLSLSLRGRADLFLASTIERMLAHLQVVLESAVADPAARPSAYVLQTTDEALTLAAANATTIDLGAPATVTSLIEAAGNRASHAIALVADGTSLTWADLDRRANQLAHHLREAGVERGAPVGLCLDRSAAAIVGLLAVLKAGGCYVPLAPDAPASRIAQQLAECGARVVVTNAVFLHLLPATSITVALDRDAGLLATRSTERMPDTATPADRAYILFTSGSTGVPKGVAITHANLVNYIRGISRVLAGTADGVRGDGLAALAGWSFGMVSALAADLGNTALFPALCSGGTLHLLPESATTEPARYAAYLSQHRIDVMKMTPNHLRALIVDRSIGELATLLPARWLVLGGEALQWDLAGRLAAAGGCRVLNHYGPTETTVGASTCVVGPREASPAAATVPIGRPLANVQLHVLDSHDAEAPVGVPGELHIGGAGVAQGYVNRAELTAERFRELPRLGRVYRTGDRVRRLPSGDIEFLGRVDHQVKVRGFRVELGEIEQAISGFPGVAQCVVVLRPDGADGDATLAAYVVPQTTGYAAAHAERPTPAALQRWVAERLPDYMVPAAVVMLEELPLTRNGKVDRAALPAPEAAGQSREFVAPRNPTEIALAGIWAEALKRDQAKISMTDDFLALGGHSLIAIRILGKISRTFGLRLPLRTLFDAPSIAQLAELVDVERKLAALEAGTT